MGAGVVSAGCYRELVVEQPSPAVTVRMFADALTALGTWSSPPNERDLDTAIATFGAATLAARLANALYGSAVAHVMFAETEAVAAGATSLPRGEAWTAAGADTIGAAALLNYQAARVANDLELLTARLPMDLGYSEALAATARAFQQLIELLTITSVDDPRHLNTATNLETARQQLDTAAAGIERLLDTVTAISQLVIHPDDTTPGW